MTSPAILTQLEDIIDSSGAAPRMEALLPAGVRHRQLRVRTLLLGMQLTLADRRPAFLTGVHAALISLPGPDQVRLGVMQDWNNRPHQLTYRQVERTFGLAARALSKDAPGGAPSGALARICDDLLEASIPAKHKQASSALAVDWTGVETFARPPRHGTTECAGPEASWGHRTSNLPGPKGELFFGYYHPAATMVCEERGPDIPELARRMTLTSCATDPARALVPVLTRMPEEGIPLGDILDDSGYAHRDAETWAIPLRHAGAQLVQDLHPHDRGPKGTHQGAIVANGNLYCPATPRPLLHPGPLAPAATTEDTAAHDQKTTELSRYKPGRTTADDADAYHRVMCPAVMGKIRCPLRPGPGDPGPLPAQDPHPARTPTRLLHPADPHRPARGRSQDPAKTRLPLQDTPDLLPPPHRIRAHLLHHQRPCQQRHQPRLVPPDGPDPAHLVAGLPARRPQPAHPGRLPPPPGRQRPAGRRRAPTQNPQTPAPHTRHACRRPAITRQPAPHPAETRQPQPPRQSPRAHSQAPPAPRTRQQPRRRPPQAHSPPHHRQPNVRP
jgi:hypothetical protein